MIQNHNPTKMNRIRRNSNIIQFEKIKNRIKTIFKIYIMTNYRIESDSFGDLKVPKDKYWGAQTQRSIINFPIGCEKQPFSIIKSLGFIKAACAKINIIQGKIDPKLVKQLLKHL